MEIKNGRVLIDQRTYDKLVKDSFELENLKMVMYMSCVLTWRDKEVRFDGDLLAGYMKAVDTNRYMDAYYRLMDEKREQAEREAKDDVG
ncbi:MAG: hypothetical protein IJP45_09110 [Paludibacteraceae bacterium]|nr:hypothetical protein [Paludibacteraceae bacterium]